MIQEEVIEMARQAGFTVGYGSPALPKHEAFAKLVEERTAAKERERIIEANKPELDKCNAYIKELEDKLARGEA